MQTTTKQTLPGFKGRYIQGGQAETKAQSRKRNDKYAASRYAKRPDIDRYNEDRALRRELREVWDD